MNKNRIKSRNKVYFLTVIIPFAHVYSKTEIVIAARNGRFLPLRLTTDGRNMNLNPL